MGKCTTHIDDSAGRDGVRCGASPSRPSVQKRSPQVYRRSVVVVVFVVWAATVVVVPMPRSRTAVATMSLFVVLPALLLSLVFVVVGCCSATGDPRPGWHRTDHQPNTSRTVSRNSEQQSTASKHDLTHGVPLWTWALSVVNGARSSRAVARRRQRRRPRRRRRRRALPLCPLARRGRRQRPSGGKGRADRYSRSVCAHPVRMITILFHVSCLPSQPFVTLPILSIRGRCLIK